MGQAQAEILKVQAFLSLVPDFDVVLFLLVATCVREFPVTVLVALTRGKGQKFIFTDSFPKEVHNCGQLLLGYSLVRIAQLGDLSPKHFLFGKIIWANDPSSLV